MWRISDAELARRRRRVLEEMADRGAGAFVTYNPTSIFYLTNFYFIPTERPIALILTAADRAVLFVPRLELEHAQLVARVDEVRDYPEYPGDAHPMTLLAGLLRDLGLGAANLLAEAAGYSSHWGYDGPALAELLPDARVTVDARLIERHRMVKSAEEIALIRESCRWGNLAHELLQEYSRAGASEVEISARASHEATMAMLKTFGRSFRPVGRVGAYAGFRGQVGANSALPHAVTINATLRKGDVLVTGATSYVGGYCSELERTMFVGEPSPEQARFFQLMVALQDVALGAIKPGVPCAAVDREVRRFYAEHDLQPYWRHHVGHNIGLLGHEAPFLDIGDETVIQPGMVFTVEPGIYVPGLGGFRHSDTVLVTEDGIEMLTYYPRDLDSLICGV
ncbi:MAG TPA: Xaa-Pro peptidase family protein [Thermaerobacter sp.]